jgi:Tol biopolymer transport system component
MPTRRQLFGFPTDGVSGAGVKTAATAAVAVGGLLALEACAPPPAPTSPPLHTYNFRQLNGYRRDLMICDQSGRNLTNIVQGVYGRAGWSTNGAFLVFSRGIGDDSTGTWALWACARSGKQLHQITRPASGVADLDPVFSPDGHTIAFTRDTVGFGAGQGIWVVQTSGQNLHYVAGGAGGITPCFSPDGKTIAYAARDGIRTIPVSGGTSKLIAGVTGPYQCSQPAWSPDGKLIAFIRKSGSTYTLNYIGASGGSGKVLVQSSLGLECPSWLRDSKSLAFVRFNGAGAEGRSNVLLYHRSLAGKQRLAFRPFGGTPTDMSTWAP